MLVGFSPVDERSELACLNPNCAKNSKPQVQSTKTPLMSIKIIDYAAVKEVENSPEKNTFLIDVRDTEEFQAGHIPTALNIPLKEFRETMLLSNDEWISVYGKEKPLLSDRMVIYCRSGRRSNLASLEAIELHYSWVENYAGSWIEYSSFLAAA
ncbi:Rhodanese-like domain-containing protein [Umbelopsis sp. AD052]|nr:Rhodanese-like domain-containing protein [Umbelopsis sp. AD052]